MHDSLPTSDKSLSRFLGEVPFLPDSAFKFLEDICHSSTNHHGKDDFDGDRVTQGLGIVWSLILLRPQTRQSCLNIALKVLTFFDKIVHSIIFISQAFTFGYAVTFTSNFDQIFLEQNQFCRIGSDNQARPKVSQKVLCDHTVGEDA